MKNQQIASVAACDQHNAGMIGSPQILLACSNRPKTFSRSMSFGAFPNPKPFACSQSASRAQPVDQRATEWLICVPGKA